MAALFRGRNHINCVLGATKTSRQLQNLFLQHGMSMSRLQTNTQNAYSELKPVCAIQARRFSSKNNDDMNKLKSETHTSVWQQLQSPPNIITLTRMASTPVLAYWITSEQYVWAVLGCALAGLSDRLDGFLAKKYNWGTTVGTYLDPMSDKVLVNGLAISLWYSNILPTPLIVVWAIKDVGLLSGTAWMLYKNYNSINFFTTSLAHKPLEVNPTAIAKLNTALQFATLGVGIISPLGSFSPIVLDTLCWATAATTVGSVVSYAGKSAIKETTSKGD